MMDELVSVQTKETRQIVSAFTKEQWESIIDLAPEEVLFNHLSTKYFELKDKLDTVMNLLGGN